MAETRPVCRVGVDIGGTFTDIVALTEGGRAAVVKVASTPDDYGRGVLRGLADALAELDLPAAGVAEIVHGFTVATNAILEGKGAAMALITTEGFRDVLEIARLRTPRLYDLTYRKPPPLVERRLRLEVRERVDARGRVLAPLDAGDVERAVAAVREAGVPSVAVSLLHSYANPSHEQRIGDALRAELPALDVSLSSELLPEAREYERTSTTVINGYIRPVVERYLQRLGRRAAPRRHRRPSDRDAVQRRADAGRAGRAQAHVLHRVGAGRRSDRRGRDGRPPRTSPS